MMPLWCRIGLAFLGPLLSSASARASDIPILGDWTITNAIVAPWVGEDADDGSLALDAKGHLHMKVTFEPDRVIAKDPRIGCTNASYERTLLAPHEIFQGSLPEPDQIEIARNLGFPSGEIPGFDVACSSGLFSYHFADMDTLLFALDNVIYTIERG
jgi:hypothetical protein